jgi:C-terminal processing protease CtpA/Prc
VRERSKNHPKLKKIDAIISQAKKDLAAANHRKHRDQVIILRDTLFAIAKAGGPTAFLATDEDQDFAAWQSAFSGSLEGARVPEIGVHVQRLGAKWFIAKVYAGSVAQQAGLMDGDEWLRTDGKPAHPIHDLKQAKPGVPLTLTVKRRADGSPKDVQVTPGFLSVQEVLATHMDKSHRTLSAPKRPGPGGPQATGDLTFAYVALPAASHLVFRNQLARLASKYQSESDAMILDLRHGIIGPDATYVEPFLGEGAVYTHPLVLLVDRSTGGGRERLAEILQKTGRARLVGEPTQGLREVLDFQDVIPGESALIYTVPSLNPKAGAENRPLKPDHPLESVAIYSAGADEALGKALSVAHALIPKRS